MCAGMHNINGLCECPARMPCNESPVVLAVAVC